MKSKKHLSRRNFLGAAALTSIAIPLTQNSSQAKESPNHSISTSQSVVSDEKSNLLIAILLYDELTALDAIGPYEVLTNIPGAKVLFVAEKPGAVSVDTRELALVAQAKFSDVTQPDVIVVPGGSYGTKAATANERLLEWIRTAHASSRWTTSVCTGSLILGAAGLLKELNATTHWASSDYLNKFGAKYVPERFVRQGEIVAAAGVSAGIDMSLFLAGEIGGSDVARAIQLAIEYDPHPPFDSGSPRKASKETIELMRRLLGKRTGRNL